MKKTPAFRFIISETKLPVPSMTGSVQEHPGQFVTGVSDFTAANQVPVQARYGSHPFFLLFLTNYITPISHCLHISQKIIQSLIYFELLSWIKRPVCAPLHAAFVRARGLLTPVKPQNRDKQTQNPSHPP
ncbi:MAG: hypothetical protein ACI4O7_12230 [Aristaeellaceae bacterium]